MTSGPLSLWTRWRLHESQSMSGLEARSLIVVRTNAPLFFLNIVTYLGVCDYRRVIDWILNLLSPLGTTHCAASREVAGSNPDEVDFLN
jgi:hypothetical protein